MDIAPGCNILLEVVKWPRAAAARKTLVRLFRADPEARRRQRSQKRKRPSWQTWRRGGRMWHHQMKSKPGLELQPGAKAHVLATVDVIRDLARLAPYVKVCKS